jgi:hypothetical protein
MLAMPGFLGHAASFLIDGRDINISFRKEINSKTWRSLFKTME